MTDIAVPDHDPEDFLTDTLQQFATPEDTDDFVARMQLAADRMLRIHDETARQVLELDAEIGGLRDRLNDLYAEDHYNRRQFDELERSGHLDGEGARLILADDQRRMRDTEQHLTDNLKVRSSLEEDRDAVYAAYVELCDQAGPTREEALEDGVTPPAPRWPAQRGGVVRTPRDTGQLHMGAVQAPQPTLGQRL
jgi:hypothetical protein